MELRYYMKSYPTTTGISILMALGFMGDLIGINQALAFLGLESLSKPWTMMTYPFAFVSPPGFAFLSALFAIVTLWFIGRVLERRWRSWGWVCFFILTSLAASVWSTAMGLFGFGIVPLYEPWIVLGGAIMLWAWENPEMPLLAYGLFPIKAIYLAWIYVAFNFFLLFPSGLPAASTTLVPIGVVWLWLRIVRPRGNRGNIRKKVARHRSYLKRVK